MVTADRSSFSDWLIKLHRQVRLGNFLNARRFLNELATPIPDDICETAFLRIATLRWETYDTLGDYGRAAESLRTVTAKSCRELIENAVSHPTKFGEIEFAGGKSQSIQLESYRLWRQRVVVVMAQGIDAYRAQLPKRAEHLLEAAHKFVYDCLVPRGFQCHGTRARLHYFTALVRQRGRALAAAETEFDRALKLCVTHLNDQLAVTFVPERQDLERQFANYATARIHIGMGELDLDRGRLKAAARHLLTSQTLLRSTQDHYSFHQADLLLSKIARSDEQFSAEGWKLLDRFSRCRKGLEGHPVYHLEASVEEVKTAVYLHRAKKPVAGSPPTNHLSSIEDALRSIDKLILEIAERNLVHTRFHAILVKARILSRLGRHDEALEAISQAQDLYPNGAPDPLAAEADFVRAKAEASQQRYHLARQWFNDALRKCHESRVFQASCHLQILQMLVNEGRRADAQEHVERYRSSIGDVESTFLQERFTKLTNELDRSTILPIQFDPSFNLDEARASLDRFYIVNLAAVVDKAPREILKDGYWKELQRRRTVPDDKRRVRTLINKYFPAKAARA